MNDLGKMLALARRAAIEAPTLLALETMRPGFRWALRDRAGARWTLVLTVNAGYE